MRQSHLISLRTGLLAVGLGCAVLFASGAQAAGPDQQYQQDIQRCGTNPDVDQKACLKEAGAAAQAAKNGHLTSPSVQAESLNRTQRCDALSGTQRQDCLTLMDSSSTETQGSVLSGGVLRQTTIPIPAPVTQ
ncbi:hypothetical protein [Castellaniella sp.]|uniref:hypothetical protein n=1 Tax=Castellaniella sp. TaxID=1955812 RepID=UPI002AFEB387|nr:hypothetical protein [Castellaniella sp.]